MMFVVRSVRCNAPVRPRRCTVSVSSSPSRMDAAAPGWSRSRDPASRSSRIEASQRFADRGVSRSGRWPELMGTLHHAARTEHVGDGPAQPRRVDDEQQRPVGRQAPRHQVAEQTGRDRSRLGGAFAQAQHVLPPLGVDAQRDHHAVVPEHLAVDADHPQVQLAQRPGEKRMQALGRQRHEPPRHRAARRRPLVHRGRHRVQRARVPPRRHPGGDRASVCSSGSGAAHWKLASGTSPSALRTRSRGTSTCRPPSVTWLSTLPPRHDLVAPLRATQRFPIRLHHRLQDLAVAMHKPWNASRTPLITPSTGSGT